MVSSIVGPMIGGALAKPVESLPSVFRPGSIWDRFPYLLPNLFSATCVSLGVIIGLLFLEETHAEKKKRRDRGVELGNYLLSLLPSLGAKGKSRSPAKGSDEEQPLLFDADEALPEYLTSGNLTGPSSASGPSGIAQQEARTGTQRPRQESRPTARIFTKPVVTIIASYGILAL